MSSFFIKHPTIAIVISIVMILLGGLSLMGLPIEQYPNIVPPTIKMQATYPGANAETVANSVASPIEQSISGVVGMDYMTSTNANNGICSLSIVFEVGTDPNMDQTLAYMRYGQATAQIPAEVSQMGITITQSTGSPLAVINLYSPDDSLNAIFLSNYAYVSLVDPVKRVPGVGDVQVFGAGRYAMRIWLDTTKMAAQNISVGEVQSAIRAQNTVIPGGQIGAEPAPPGTEFTYSIQTKGRLQTAEEFGNIIIRADGNKLLYLKDIAKVELGSQTYNVSSKYNGRDSGAIAVYAAPGSNAINTVDALVKLFEDRARSFPAGMEYNVTLDTTLAVRASIEEIEHTLVEALLLVVLVVFVFLQGWRATLIPAIAVPVSIIATFALFPLLGFTLNTICLMGMVLAIGLVVDDAIVVVEAVESHMERGLTPRQAAFAAMEEVSGPVIAIALVLAAVFLPSLLLPGITGTLFQQFAVTIAISMLISAFNALTLSLPDPQAHHLHSPAGPDRVRHPARSQADSQRLPAGRRPGLPVLRPDHAGSPLPPADNCRRGQGFRPHPPEPEREGRDRHFRLQPADRGAEHEQRLLLRHAEALGGTPQSGPERQGGHRPAQRPAEHQGSGRHPHVLPAPGHCRGGLRQRRHLHAGRPRRQGHGIPGGTNGHLCQGSKQAPDIRPAEERRRAQRDVLCRGAEGRAAG